MRLLLIKLPQKNSDLVRIGKNIYKVCARINYTHLLWRLY